MTKPECTCKTPLPAGWPLAHAHDCPVVACGTNVELDVPVPVPLMPDGTDLIALNGFNSAMLDLNHYRVKRVAGQIHFAGDGVQVISASGRRTLLPLAAYMRARVETGDPVNGPMVTIWGPAAERDRLIAMAQTALGRKEPMLKMVNEGRRFEKPWDPFDSLRPDAQETPPEPEVRSLGYWRRKASEVACRRLLAFVDEDEPIAVTLAKIETDARNYLVAHAALNTPPSSEHLMLAALLMRLDQLKPS